MRNTELTNIPHPFITDTCEFQKEEEEEEDEITSRMARLRPSVEQGNIRVYPNPANDQVNVDLGEAIDGTIKIYSSTGELVRSRTLNRQQRFNQIAVRDLPAGLYVINVTTKKGVKSISFTKL